MGKGKERKLTRKNLRELYEARTNLGTNKIRIPKDKKMSTTIGFGRYRMFLVVDIKNDWNGNIFHAKPL